MANTYYLEEKLDRIENMLIFIVNAILLGASEMDKESNLAYNVNMAKELIGDEMADFINMYFEKYCEYEEDEDDED